MDFFTCLLACYLLVGGLASDSENLNDVTESQTCDAEDSECSENPSAKLNFGSHALLLPDGRQPESNPVPGTAGIYVSIKTTVKYHESRLPLIMLTWMQTIESEQIHIVTDGGDNESILQVAKNMGFHVTHCQCPADHRKQSLCCKSGVEYDQYFLTQEQRDRDYKWYCHFDDDIYVNVPKLVTALERFVPTKEKVYFGRWPLHGTDKQVNMLEKFVEEFPDHKRTSYQFATGAAYCISTLLMKEVENYLRGDAFERNCDKLRVPDDMMVGIVIGAVLGYELSNEFSVLTHLNRLTYISSNSLQEKITISYGELKFVGQPVIKNVVTIPNALFSEEEDHTRFLSYHCLLYPSTSWCHDDKVR